MSLLRTSGDVSQGADGNNAMAGFAPHERRCFSIQTMNVCCLFVCSARAEMFPSEMTSQTSSCSLLRTSGDVSHLIVVADTEIAFAPHERRCFWDLHSHIH